MVNTGTRYGKGVAAGFHSVIFIGWKEKEKGIAYCASSRSGKQVATVDPFQLKGKHYIGAHFKPEKDANVHLTGKIPKSGQNLSAAFRRSPELTPSQISS